MSIQWKKRRYSQPTVVDPIAFNPSFTSRPVRLMIRGLHRHELRLSVSDDDSSKVHLRFMHAQSHGLLDRVTLLHLSGLYMNIRVKVLDLDKRVLAESAKRCLISTSDIVTLILKDLPTW